MEATKAAMAASEDTATLAALLDGDGEGVAAAPDEATVAPLLVAVAPVITIGVDIAAKLVVIPLAKAVSKAVLPEDKRPPVQVAAVAKAALANVAVYAIAKVNDTVS